MEILRKLKWEHLLLALGLVVSLVITGIFAVRVMRHLPHRVMDERIRPWMTLSYIARSHRVPVNVLYQALGLPETPNDRRTITTIAKDEHRTVQSIITALEDAITHARPPFSSPAPPTPSAPTPTPQPNRSITP